MQPAAKRPTAQRHPPTIQQVSAREEMVTRAPTVQDRNRAGFCTFLCLPRARFSDAMHGKAILDDSQADPRTLGYHIASDETSCLTFGRDNQSEPLRWVERVLEAIRSGEFVPDQTRSGRFKEGSDPINEAKEMFTTRAMTKPAKIDALEHVLLVVVEVDKKSQDSASGSSSNDSATSEEPANLLHNEDLARHVGRPITYVYTCFTSHRLYQHTESGTLHWASFAILSKLECGRLLSNRFAKISQALRVNWRFCAQCAKKVQAEEIVAAST